MVIYQHAAGGVGTAGVRFLHVDGTAMTVAEQGALESLFLAGASLPVVGTVAVAVETWRWQVRAGA